MQLVYTKTQKPVQVGDTVTDFRGDKAVVVSMEKPRHSGSTGRVYVKEDGGFEHGYYPSVYDMKWI